MLKLGKVRKTLSGNNFEIIHRILIFCIDFVSIYTVNGFTGNLEEIGEKFGILPQTIQYRMKYRGMGLEEAVTTPVGNNGRKKKEE